MLLSEVKLKVRVRHKEYGDGTIIGLYTGYLDNFKSNNIGDRNFICIKFDNQINLHNGLDCIIDFKGHHIPNSTKRDIYFSRLDDLSIIKQSSPIYKSGSLEASISLLEELDKEEPEVISEVILPKIKSAGINPVNESELRKELLEIAKKDASLNITLDPSVFNVKLPTLNTNF